MQQPTTHESLCLYKAQNFGTATKLLSHLQACCFEGNYQTADEIWGVDDSLVNLSQHASPYQLSHRTKTDTTGVELGYQFFHAGKKDWNLPITMQTYQPSIMRHFPVEPRNFIVTPLPFCFEAFTLHMNDINFRMWRKTVLQLCTDIRGSLRQIITHSQKGTVRGEILHDVTKLVRYLVKYGMMMTFCQNVRHNGSSA